VPAFTSSLLDALHLALLSSLPLLCVAWVVALGIGLLQAATQITEPAVNAIARLLVGLFALSLSAGWMGSQIMSFTTTLWQSMPGRVP
jgi:flagellar biosynthesis protein FliQ